MRNVIALDWAKRCRQGLGLKPGAAPGPDLEGKTGVLYSAGSDGAWRGDEGVVALGVEAFRPHFPPKQLELEVYDENTGEDDELIGRSAERSRVHECQ
jgi:hypothetical protein